MAELTQHEKNIRQAYYDLGNRQGYVSLGGVIGLLAERDQLPRLGVMIGDVERILKQLRD